jgi:hypothetical protein
MAMPSAGNACAICAGSSWRRGIRAKHVSPRFLNSAPIAGHAPTGRQLAGIGNPACVRRPARANTDRCSFGLVGVLKGLRELVAELPRFVEVSSSSPRLGSKTRDPLRDLASWQKHERIGIETGEGIGKIGERHALRLLDLIRNPEHSVGHRQLERSEPRIVAMLFFEFKHDNLVW